ncbi:A-kinase-interacting protein 1-like [Corythoichthys intestinalis]|uniref:A-kinase-interacting protein 1-like n=1 Tax=Corythoichthys intestinalis TaxID=161448 RepID=UPI0025A5A70D|nr:A-kinase-interacting protein 1-like [Corythoichthys intestinalis]XP_061812846.1 A-kinase-interacting protein 1-like [Nerophis lumbriciformis]
MDSLTWLNYSLHQTARLGLEVLERASKRMDWTVTPRKHTTNPEEEDERVVYTKNSLAALQEAFSSITDLMAETNIQCKKYYDSMGCTHGPDIEKKHGPRYHKHIPTTSNLSPRGHQQDGSQVEPNDFYVVVPAGSYTISADQPGHQQQTKMIDLKAGDTVSITFNF